MWAAYNMAESMRQQEFEQQARMEQARFAAHAHAQRQSTGLLLLRRGGLLLRG